MRHRFNFTKRFKEKKLRRLFITGALSGVSITSLIGASSVYAAGTVGDLTSFTVNQVKYSDGTVLQLSPSSVKAIRDASIPEPPKNGGYAVVNINIREQPDVNSKVIGKYLKGDKVNILGVIDDNKSWVKTDKGYIWGGYLSESYNHSLNVHSDSEYASQYVGYVYHVIDQLDESYLKYLKNYEIIICENPEESFGKESDMTIANGLTNYVKNGDSYRRRMYLRSSTKSIPKTVLHELGHIVDFENYNDVSLLSDADEVKRSMETEKDTIKEKYNLLDGNLANTEEYFAETFALSIQDPDGLKEVAPIIAGYLEEIKNNYC